MNHDVEEYQEAVTDVIARALPALSAASPDVQAAAYDAAAREIARLWPPPSPAAPRRIVVEIRNVYGNDLTYPACDESRLLARLTGSKTFTRAHLATIRELGYEITETCEHAGRRA